VLSGLGRTAPTLRSAVREEVRRLRSLLKHVRNDELRKGLEEGLRNAEGLHDAYLETELPMDPLEVVILSMIADLYRRCLRVEDVGSGREAG